MSEKVYRPPWRRFKRWPWWLTVRRAKSGQAVPGFFLSKGPPAVIRGPRRP